MTKSADTVKISALNSVAFHSFLVCIQENFSIRSQGFLQMPRIAPAGLKELAEEDSRLNPSR